MFNFWDYLQKNIFIADLGSSNIRVSYDNENNKTFFTYYDPVLVDDVWVCTGCKVGRYRKFSIFSSYRHYWCRLHYPF